MAPKPKRKKRSRKKNQPVQYGQAGGSHPTDPDQPSIGDYIESSEQDIENWDEPFVQAFVNVLDRSIPSDPDTLLAQSRRAAARREREEPFIELLERGMAAISEIDPKWPTIKLAESAFAYYIYFAIAADRPSATMTNEIRKQLFDKYWERYKDVFMRKLREYGGQDSVESLGIRLRQWYLRKLSPNPLTKVYEQIPSSAGFSIQEAIRGASTAIRRELGAIGDMELLYRSSLVVFGHAYAYARAQADTPGNRTRIADDIIEDWRLWLAFQGVTATSLPGPPGSAEEAYAKKIRLLVDYASRKSARRKEKASVIPDSEQESTRAPLDDDSLLEILEKLQDELTLMLREPIPADPEAPADPLLPALNPDFYEVFTAMGPFEGVLDPDKEIQDAAGPLDIVLTNIPNPWLDTPDFKHQVTVCLTSFTTRRLILERYGPIPPLPRATLTPKCEIRPAHGMGAGVFATENIRRFEVICIERPYIVFPETVRVLGVGVDGNPTQDWERESSELVDCEEALKKAISRLPTESQVEFLQLKNCKDTATVLPYLGTVLTNSIRLLFHEKVIDEEFGAGYSAVPRIGSRINHSCISNVHIDWDPKQFALRYIALRDIPQDGQILRSYASLTQPFLARQEVFRKYGFQCNCPACINWTKDGDKFRQSTLGFVKTWGKLLTTRWSKDPKTITDGTIQLILKTLERMEKEGLDVLETGYYDMVRILGDIYDILGMPEQAVIYSTLYSNARGAAR